MSEYLMYLAAGVTASLLPLRTLYWIARRIAAVHHFFDRTGRMAVRDNLRVIMGNSLEERELKRAVKQTYTNFALYLAEFFAMPKLDRRYFDSHVDIKGLQNVDAARERGRGVLVVSAHYSNWELGLAYFALCGYPAYGIVAPHANERVNNLFLKPRLAKGVRVISTKNAIEEGYEALRGNGILCMLGDRVTTKGGMATLFFGRSTTFPKGPAKFALSAHAPVVTAYIIRHPDYRFTITFDEPIYTDAMADDMESLTALMTAYTHRLENYIRRDPTQYGVFYRVWKNADSPVRGVQN
ncbi:MAG: lysophospholipid acyltransferase family protein [Candidatus Abyssubacteria bacterium]